MLLITNTNKNIQDLALVDNTTGINLPNINTDIVNTIDNNSHLSNTDSSKLLTQCQSPTQELYNKEKNINYSRHTNNFIMQSHSTAI